MRSSPYGSGNLWRGPIEHLLDMQTISGDIYYVVPQEIFHYLNLLRVSVALRLTDGDSLLD